MTMYVITCSIGKNIHNYVKGARGFLKPLKQTTCGCNNNRKRSPVIVRILKYPLRAVKSIVFARRPC